MNKIYLSKKYISDIGDIFAVSTSAGLKEVLINPWSLPELPSGDPFHVIEAIKSYFEAHKKSFDIPFDYESTDFTSAVLKKTFEIPYGQTATYGDIAAAVGKPGASRAVGSALKRNPIPIIIPCHRVLARSSLGGFALGLDTKLKLLKHEGIDTLTLR